MEVLFGLAESLGYCEGDLLKDRDKKRKNI
jgi:hypothetical protein